MTLTEINIYPIKSTAGVSLSNAWVDDFGLSFDRRFVVTDEQGQFISARTEPNLCLIQASITQQGLILTAPDMPILEVKYNSFSKNYQSVTVWKDTIKSIHCSLEIDKWFSQFLKRPCRLHFFGENSQRLVKNSHNQVGFADGYPLLLISQASLNDLNQRLANINETTVTMSHFRPNLVVENTEALNQAFIEDTWRHIRIGEVEFELVKPCSRCIMTTVNPKTAEKHKLQQPLNTLKEYRQVESGDVMFGQNLIALNKGQLKVGDNVTILDHQAPLVFVINKPVKEKAKLAIKKAPRKKRSVNILFDSWDKYIKGNTKEPILDQGENAGLILPYSCRGGMCGRCKIKLESGEVRQLADDGLTDDEKKQGYVLACSAIPESDLVLSKP
ncbi:YcbX family protein [Thalassotalea profundi]|uniref:(2Fe-2S)-binding protein n=1 Tax=Thalassotalea profundi TaxID=2036687 RepID=A0ABQ3IYD2_9GAMM|nr:YcbX family protein [Thalassotalea profundi]GHE93688.1 (2Fe-2S)-binding protein [Thalassotalea profundi]